MNDESEGIVLKQTDYRDADAIVDVLTAKYGRITLMVRGLRKITSKNAMACLLFNKSKFQLNYNEARSMQSLKCAESINNYRLIRESLEKQSIAMMMCEAIDKIKIDDADSAYDLLDKSLTYLEKTDNIYAILGLYMAKLNDMCGITPEVDACINCGRQDHIVSISLTDGGFICSDCFDINRHHKAGLQRLKYFRLFAKAGIDDFKVLEKIDCSINDCIDVIDFFCEYSGINLKSYNFLKEIAQMEQE